VRAYEQYGNLDELTRTGAAPPAARRSAAQPALRAGSNTACAIEFGMSKDEVTARWGLPNNREMFLSTTGRIERWSYGDPVLGIANGIRSVEFNEYGRAVFVRDMKCSRAMQ
jgi:hypothetical protein